MARCPNCGSGDLRPGRGRLVHCAQCGRTFVYQTPWYAVILAWALLGAVLGGGGAFLFRDVLGWDTPWIWLIIFPVIAVLAAILTRPFRTLRPARHP